MVILNHSINELEKFSDWPLLPSILKKKKEVLKLPLGWMVGPVMEGKLFIINH